MSRQILMTAIAVPLFTILVAVGTVSQECSVDNCPSSNETTPQLSAGQIVYLDPDTGELVQGDAAAIAKTEATRNSFAVEMADQMRRSFSVENLSERRTASGAIVLDLQGRFQNPLVAIIDPVEGILVGHVNREGRLE